MAKRKPVEDDDGGLDSLLDTMTNVVGILVLVLIVTQMSVAEVVSRITTENQVDEETLSELTEQLLFKKNEKDELENVLVDPLSINAEQQLQDLQLKKELLQRRRKLLDQKQKEKNDFAVKIEQDGELAKRNAEEIKNTLEQRERLKAVLQESIQRRAELQAKLDRTPKVNAPADIEVSIPNPRPAPAGAEQLRILCFQDRVYPIADEPFRLRAEERAKQIVLRGNLDRDPVAGIDPKKFEKLWSRLKDQDDFFDVEYYVLNEVSPRLKFVPREGKGANASEVVNPRSRINSAKWFGSIDPGKMYARFFVMPDSFGVYVAARGFFSKSSVLAGWEPIPKSWEYTTTVPGIRLGPPPPPPPPPPPNPTPDPNPKPPPKPPNLID